MSAHATPVTLELESIVRRYRGGFELRVPHLTVEAGSTLALLGPSGSGKSSLLEVAGLLEAPNEGRVLVDGVPRTVADHATRTTMAALFQRPYLMKATVFDNVAYGLRLRHADKSQIARKVTDALKLVGLAGFEKRASGTLSGGEAQRVALARALVLEPRVLLLDEPLASLDPILKRRMEQEFASILRAQGVTVIYVTHDPDEAMAVADAIAIIRDGRVVTCGPVAQVMSAPGDPWSASFLGVEPGVRGVVSANEDGLLTISAGDVSLAAMGGYPVGTCVLAGVRPEDVVIFEAGADVSRSTARNVLPGRVAEMAPRGSTWQVAVACGTERIAAAVSRASAEELALSVGSDVTVVFKATAVQVRACEADEGQQPCR